MKHRTPLIIRLTPEDENWLRRRKVAIAKHPGPGGSDLHSSGSDQSIHGKHRLSALQGSRKVKGRSVVTKVGEVMGTDGMPQDLKDKIVETLENRWGGSVADVERNYERILAHAEKLYKADPSLRDQHRFYERWFDMFESHAFGSKYDFDQIAGLGAVISPGLDAEANLFYTQEIAEIVAEDRHIPDFMVPLLNYSMEERQQHYLSDRYPDDWYEKSKAGKPKPVNPSRAADYEFRFEKGMRLSDVTDPHAAVIAIRDIYNRRNADGPIPRFYAPKGFDNFAKGIEILRGAKSVDDYLIGAKVRSFYNNILDPTNVTGFGDVTIDFQMTEAALWVSGGNVFPTSIAATPGRFGVALGIRPLLGDAVRKLLPKWGPRVGAESPAQLQEVMWATWKMGKDSGEWGDLPMWVESK